MTSISEIKTAYNCKGALFFSRKERGRSLLAKTSQRCKEGELKIVQLQITKYTNIWLERQNSFLFVVCWPLFFTKLVLMFYVIPV